MVPWIYDRICTSGAILACSALSAMTSLKKTMCYYGSIADFSSGKQLFTNNTIHVLMSGTIDESTWVSICWYLHWNILTPVQSRGIRNLFFMFQDKGRHWQNCKSNRRIRMCRCRNSRTSLFCWIYSVSWVMRCWISVKTSQWWFSCKYNIPIESCRVCISWLIGD